ncbi:MAG: TetR family transcriptional regulator [Actinobacteria bacterium]|nr:TetR family transcriptional regulator [Actinomycetota bacterium]
MRSVTASDDRTAKARIRDAAITCVAEHGLAATTVRKVADTAGVSPALVIHHFGSMDGLREACDRHVAEVIRDHKTKALASGPNLDVLAAFRDYEGGDLGRYLAHILTDDSPAVARLIDGMVDDAEAYIAQGVESGIIRPSEYGRERASLLAIWQLGALALHRHAERLLGLDLTDPGLTASPALARYTLPFYEMLGGGLFTEEATANLIAAMSALAASDDGAPGPTDDEGRT